MAAALPPKAVSLRRNAAGRCGRTRAAWAVSQICRRDLGDDELDRSGTDHPALPDYGFEGLLICGEAPNVIAASLNEFTGEQVSPDDRQAGPAADPQRRGSSRRRPLTPPGHSSRPSLPPG